jgi:hypothetical protein
MYELKSKIYYIIEANNVSVNLKKIYGIEINRRYLTFILPENSFTSDFQSRLQSEDLNYIFFNPFTNKFLDKVNKTELFYLELEGSLLDYNPNLNFPDLQNIIRTNNIWEKSIKKYLNKKKNFVDKLENEKEIVNTNSLHKIYINDLFNSNYYEQIKLIIPKDLIDLIKKEIIKSQDIKLKFLKNFDFNNIKQVKKLYRALIIFSINKKIYFYYEYLHWLKIDKNKYSFIKVEDADKILIPKKEELINIEKVIKNRKIKNKTNEEIIGVVKLNKKEIALKEIKNKITKIQLNDLKETVYNKKCFCFLIIDKNYLKRFIED